MPKTLPIVMAAALVVTGCTFSKVDPKATVTISGSVLAANGSPVAGAQVRVFAESDLANLVFGGVLALGTLGSICLLPDAPTVCHRGHTATTGPDGRFTLKLKGSDTQGLIGTEATLDAVVAAPEATQSDPSTTLSFAVKATTVQLPAARLWDAGQRVAEAHGAISLTWKPLPADFGSDPSFSAQLFARDQAATLWSQAAKSGSTSIDARVLEDVDGSAAASARTILSGVGTGSVHANYLSGRVPVKATAGAPPSRHRPCSAVIGAVDPTAKAQPTCGATDGDLAQPARLTGSNAEVVTGAVIDLGRAAPITFVVAHGIAGMTVVEVSTDGTHYRQVGILTDSPAALSPPGHPVARYVRVRAPSGLDESLLYEISVWTG